MTAGKHRSRHLRKCLGLAICLVFTVLGCVEKRGLWQRCAKSSDCGAGLTCVGVPPTGRRLCMGLAAAKKLKQRESVLNELFALRAQKRALRARKLRKRVRTRKEMRLLKQSGVVQPGRVERDAPPATTHAGPVRVRTTKGKGEIFAACRDTERLVGGGCDAALKTVQASRPSNYDPKDTVGARWLCRVWPHENVVAFALCMHLVEAPAVPGK